MIRIIASFLLAINGAGAVYGGILLATDPTGWKLGMPTSILQYSPFSDFLVPGLLLLIIIGVGSLLVCALTLVKARGYATWTIFMGFTLSIWIAVQMLMLRDVHALHLIYAFIGILLIVIGILERRKEFEGN
jgi:hypothetical protein